ncbi:hypothetical protein [Burkholderia cenocepacia]|uniref:Putative DNA polymerase subunit alpha n=1 Tax=Burkholderia aenigmatica TaxID=2015348 RepID=A0A6J5JSS7_9BURK|nr:hypothetical protein [Burkholderia cenocepacia]CAB3974271.1 putative DNA polymerase subunit alpha [Burkholderia aenigmatica]
MMLQGETGQVDVIQWLNLLENYRKVALGAALLAVYYMWQADGKVWYLIARKLVDGTEVLGGARLRLDRLGESEPGLLRPP